MLGERVLTLREQGDGARAGLAQELVERRLARDGEADERWLERQPDERTDREPERLAARVHGHDGDTGREPAEERAELVHVRRQGARSLRST